MKKKSLFHTILFIIVLPFVPVYFIYKSQSLNRKQKVLSITGYVLILLLLSYFGKDNELKNQTTSVSTKIEDVENSEIQVEATPESDLNQDELTSDADNSNNSDEQPIDQPDFDEDYANTVAKWSYTFGGHFQDLSELLVNNDVESATWNKKVADISSEIINDCSAVIDFKPPTDYQSINNNIVDACTNYMYGITDLLDGLRTLDEDKLSNVEIFFMFGTEHIRIAADLLNKK